MSIDGEAQTYGRNQQKLFNSKNSLVYLFHLVVGGVEAKVPGEHDADIRGEGGEAELGAGPSLAVLVGQGQELELGLGEVAQVNHVLVVWTQDLK